MSVGVFHNCIHMYTFITRRTCVLTCTVNILFFIYLFHRILYEIKLNVFLHVYLLYVYIQTILFYVVVNVMLKNIQ